MDIQEIEELFASYGAAWNANDPEKIAAHWDEDESEPFYKAEEVLSFYHSLDDIRKYWAHNEHFHEAMRMQYSDFTVKPLPGEHAIVVLRLKWDIKFAENTTTLDGKAFAHAGKTMGGRNHVIALVKNTADGLKFAGWSETPDAPITYMGQLYQWVSDTTVGS